MLPKDLKNTFDKYDKDFQTRLIKALISDTNFFDEIQDYISPDLFISLPHYTLVDLILEHYQKYLSAPSTIELKAKLVSFKDEQLVEECKFIISVIENTETNLNFIKDTSLTFCKEQKMRTAIEKASTYLKNDEYEKIWKVITDATLLESKKDMGLSYEVDVEKRLKIARRPTPTGYVLLDMIFDGGIAGGELAVICGGPSVGKSFSLVNFGKNALNAGKNVVYFTLELDEKIIAMRFDSLVTGIPINDLKNQTGTVAEQVTTFTTQSKSKLKIKQYPTKKATVQTLQIYLENLYAREGIKPDLIIVDYADLLRAMHKGEAKKRFELESVYEELRAMAVETGVPVLTASQASKEGAKSEYVTMEAMSESYAKAAVSDIVLGITRRQSGGNTNYGTCYIAKNRGAGKDGFILPIIYNTTLANFDIPSEGLVEKLRSGMVQNLAKEYFELNGLEYNSGMFHVQPTSGDIGAYKATAKKYNKDDDKLKNAF